MTFASSTDAEQPIPSSKTGGEQFGQSGDQKKPNPYFPQAKPTPLIEPVPYQVKTTDVGDEYAGIGESQSSKYNEVRKVQIAQNEKFKENVRLKQEQIKNQYDKALESDPEYQKAIQGIVQKQANILEARRMSLEALVRDGVKSPQDATAEYQKFANLYGETLQAHIQANPEVQKIQQKYGKEAQTVFDDYYDRVAKQQEAINKDFDREAYQSIGPWESFGNSIVNEVISTAKVLPQTGLIVGEFVESPDLIKSSYDKIKAFDEIYLPTKQVVKSYEDGDYAGALAAGGGYSINFLGSVLRGAASYGTSPYIEMTAPMYVASIDAKAEETGKTPEQVIAEDLEDEITPMATGVAMSVLEIANIRPVIQNFKGSEKVAKDILKQELKSQAPAMYQNLKRISLNAGKTSARESLTEGAQNMIQAGGEASFAQGKDMFNREGGKAFWKGMVEYSQSPEMIETLVGTAIGGAPLGFIGGGKKAFTDIENFGELDADEYDRIKLAVGDEAKLFQSVDKLVESGKMNKEVANKVKEKVAYFNSIDSQITANVSRTKRPKAFEMLQRLNEIEDETKGKNKQLATPLLQEAEQIENDLTAMVAPEAAAEEKKKERTTVEQYGDKQEIKTKASEKKGFVESLGEVEDISDVLEDGKAVQIGDAKVIMREEPDKVVIESIETPTEKRGQGAARKAMTQITEQADENGTVLELNVVPQQGIEKDRLTGFYESLGFEKTEGDKMVRTPKIQSNDSENEKRISGSLGERQESQQTQSNQGTGSEAASSDRVLQTQEGIAENDLQELNDAIEKVRANPKSKGLSESEIEQAAAHVVGSDASIDEAFDHVREVQGENQSIFDEITELSDQINELKGKKSGVAKRREASHRRRELLESNPDVKMIDDNIKKIYDQLESKGIIKRVGNCP